MATIDHGTDARPYKLTHFTPMNRASWHWCFMRPELSLSGPQRMIDGAVVDIGPRGVTAWGHVKGTPSFKTRAELLAWAERERFAYDLAEID